MFDGSTPSLDAITFCAMLANLEELEQSDSNTESRAVVEIDYRKRMPRWD
jgi:hypothetical protein